MATLSPSASASPSAARPSGSALVVWRPRAVMRANPVGRAPAVRAEPFPEEDRLRRMGEARRRDPVFRRLTRPRLRRAIEAYEAALRLLEEPLSLEILRA